MLGRGAWEEVRRPRRDHLGAAEDHRGTSGGESRTTAATAGRDPQRLDQPAGVAPSPRVWSAPMSGYASARLDARKNTGAYTQSTAWSAVRRHDHSTVVTGNDPVALAAAVYVPATSSLSSQRSSAVKRGSPETRCTRAVCPPGSFYS